MPIYIEALQKARLYSPYETANWYLQEDGDPSHRHKKNGLAEHLKRENWIDNLAHPPQSPDLNPMEACWNILKQRIRRHVWRDLEELKAIIQQEWSNITMQEVRARISDMPGRCKLLVETGGKAIKSAQW